MKKVFPLCSQAIKLYPYEEWQMIQMDCLLAMNRYREQALNVYEDTTMLFLNRWICPAQKDAGSFSDDEQPAS